MKWAYFIEHCYKFHNSFPKQVNRNSSSNGIFRFWCFHKSFPISSILYFCGSFYYSKTHTTVWVHSEYTEKDAISLKLLFNLLQNFALKYTEKNLYLSCCVFLSSWNMQESRCEVRRYLEAQSCIQFVKFTQASCLWKTNNSEFWCLSYLVDLNFVILLW